MDSSCSCALAAERQPARSVWTRILGGAEVGEIGLGCMNLSHAYDTPPPPEQGQAVLRRAVELGVTHFDSAALYGFGRNETLVGAALGPRRPQIQLASKCGVTGVDGRRRIDGRPETAKRTCLESLGRLGADVIEPYYLHRWVRRVPIEEIVGALGELVAVGHVRAIGRSEVSAATLRRAHAVHPIAVAQREYSLWIRPSPADAASAKPPVLPRWNPDAACSAPRECTRPSRTPGCAQQECRGVAAGINLSRPPGLLPSSPRAMRRDDAANATQTYWLSASRGVNEIRYLRDQRISGHLPVAASTARAAPRRGSEERAARFGTACASQYPDGCQPSRVAMFDRLPGWLDSGLPDRERDESYYRRHRSIRCRPEPLRSRRPVCGQHRTDQSIAFLSPSASSASPGRL